MYQVRIILIMLNIRWTRLKNNYLEKPTHRPSRVARHAVGHVQYRPTGAPDNAGANARLACDLPLSDPRFIEKLEDIVGLYMSPPEHALVLCVDEKSQVQALDRTQPGLPLKKGAGRNHDPRLQTQWHDDAIRCTQRTGWSSHRAMPTAPYPR